MWNHGGDWAGYTAEYGRAPLDFSASVSPLGLPEGVRQAAVRALSQDSGAYPDPRCRALRQALGAQLQADPEMILCGNGASALIHRLAAAVKPRRALVTAPCFSEYEAALALWNCEIRRYPLRAEQGFRVGPDFPALVTPGTDLVFLCQPNNPTGVSVPRALLLEILDACGRNGALLVVDECFLEFLEEPGAMTLLPFVRGHRLLLLRAFTKLYGMAGLRLGYCITEDRALLDRMDLAGPPWSVSGPAQAAGLAALEEEAYVEQVRRLVFRQRRVLQAGLRELGLQVIPGEANFLLFRGDPELGERLRRRGILLRDCRSFRGLGPGWYRAAVRGPEDNRRLLETIGEEMKWQSGS